MPKSKKRKVPATSPKAKTKKGTVVTSGGKAQQIPARIEGKKTVLHVGCGYPGREKLPQALRGDEWQEIRLDIDPVVKPDIISDIKDMAAVPENYTDALYSSHNLEHIYNFEVQQALQEFLRVIKVGGFAYITLPDLQAVALHVAQGTWDEPLYKVPSGPITPRDIFYGLERQMAKGNIYMAHKNGFTAHSLGRALLKAGFCNVLVERDKHYNLWARGQKLPKDHPEYKNQAQVKGNYPFAVVRRSDGSDDPEGRTDELDAEPKRWNAPKL